MELGAGRERSELIGFKAMARKIAGWGAGLGRAERRAAFFMTMTILALGAAVRAKWQMPGAAEHLGGEYFNIARALVDGRGFADPFGEATGPTAWMPPLYPTLLASILMVTKSRSVTALIVTILSDLSLATIGTTIYSIALRTRRRLSPLFAVALYLAWVVAFNYWMLLLTHDVWLIALEVNLAGIALFMYLRRGEGNPWLLGLLGGLFVLTSPALALAWYAMLCIGWCRVVADRPRFVRAALLGIIVAVPWTVRNFLVFHQIIAIKSNVFFDAYQGTYVSSDGIYDDLTISHHPLAAWNPRFFFASLGEPGYVAQYREWFVDALAKNPGRYFRAVTHRAIAAFFRSVALNNDHQTAFELVGRQALYPLPWIGACGAVATRSPNARLAAVFAGFSAIYLLPYVFIAFYVRYILPLTPLLVLLMFWGCDAVADLLSRKAPGAPKTGVPADSSRIPCP